MYRNKSSAINKIITFNNFWKDQWRLYVIFYNYVNNVYSKILPHFRLYRNYNQNMLINKCTSEICTQILLSSMRIRGSIVFFCLIKIFIKQTMYLFILPGKRPNQRADLPQLPCAMHYTPGELLSGHLNKPKTCFALY